MSFTYNLRHHYLIFVTFSTLALVSISIITNQHIKNFSDDTLANSSLRVNVSNFVHALHSHIDRANQLLNLFLLSPSLQYRQQFLVELRISSKTVSRISTSPWITEYALHNELNDITENIKALSKIANTLMDMRLENTQVFPAIAVAEKKMFFSQADFIEHTNRAISEIRTSKPFDIKLYDDFILIRDKWRRLILAYRLYIIYQMGSLNTDISASTIQNINLYSNDIMNSLNTTFVEHESRENLGIESKVAIDTIKKIALDWIDAFNEVKLIQLKGQWRSDIQIILNKVNPIYEEIYYNLNQIELSLNLSSENDIKNQKKTSDAISNYLWIIIIVFISILSFIYFIIDRTLLNPISNLAKNIETNEYINFSSSQLKSKSTEMNNFLSAFSKMQKQIKSREVKLEYLALHDGLTTLPNRTLLFDRINVAINNYQRYKILFALFMLDLNKFKEVNDTLGHKIGDEVLIQVAERLKKLLRKTDSVARIGGDEFSILMLNVDNNAIKDLAIKINSSLKQIFYINDQKIKIGTSIGIAIFPKHGFTHEMLMQKADLAMYHSKKYKTKFTIYQSKLDENNSSQAN